MRALSCAGPLGTILGLLNHFNECGQQWQLENAKEFFETNAESLRTFPHPKISKLTFLDWVNWMWSNSGKAGKMKALKEAQKILESRLKK